MLYVDGDRRYARLTASCAPGKIDWCGEAGAPGGARART